jgi:hypothetical protein
VNINQIGVPVLTKAHMRINLEVVLLFAPMRMITSGDNKWIRCNTMYNYTRKEWSKAVRACVCVCVCGRVSESGSVRVCMSVSKGVSQQVSQPDSQ